jgi:DNA polymerase-3 subunit alpha
MLGGGPAAAPAPEPAYPDVDEWLPKQKLGFEKEALGFYISGHPLDRYLQDLQRFRATQVADLETKEERAEVSVGGVVCDYRDRPLKSGNGRMAFFSLEDPSGQVEVICFSRPFAEFEGVLKSDEPLLVTGAVVAEGEGEARQKKLHMKDAKLLAQLRSEKTRQVVVQLPADSLDGPKLAALKGAIAKAPGPAQVVLQLVVPMRSRTEVQLPKPFAVQPTDELLAALERLCGQGAVRLR